MPPQLAVSTGDSACVQQRCCAERIDAYIFARGLAGVPVPSTPTTTVLQSCGLTKRCVQVVTWAAVDSCVLRSSQGRLGLILGHGAGVRSTVVFRVSSVHTWAHIHHSVHRTAYLLFLVSSLTCPLSDSKFLGIDMDFAQI